MRSQKVLEFSHLDLFTRGFCQIELVFVLLSLKCEMTNQWFKLNKKTMGCFLSRVFRVFAAKLFVLLSIPEKKPL